MQVLGMSLVELLNYQSRKAGYSDGVVIIRYRDSQNVETKIQKDLEDI